MSKTELAREWVELHNERKALTSKGWISPDELERCKAIHKRLGEVFDALSAC